MSATPESAQNNEPSSTPSSSTPLPLHDETNDMASTTSTPFLITTLSKSFSNSSDTDDSIVAKSNTNISSSRSSSSTQSNANNEYKKKSKHESPKPSKRAKTVSFSREVLSKDNAGDGNKVVIQEEHGIFLGPLLGRLVVSEYNDRVGEGEEGGSSYKTSAASTTAGSLVSFGMDSHDTMGAYSNGSNTKTYSNGILKSSHNNNKNSNGDDNGNKSMTTEYDNLVVQMGLLKCGHRYRVIVPVPDYWKNKSSKSQTKFAAEATTNLCMDATSLEHLQSYRMGVRIVEESLDGDLHGTIETEKNMDKNSAMCDDDDDDDNDASQHCVNITLSARRRGPYRGRFVLELTRLAFNGKSTMATDKTASTALPLKMSELNDAPSISIPASTISLPTAKANPMKIEEAATNSTATKTTTPLLPSSLQLNGNDNHTLSAENEGTNSNLLLRKCIMSIQVDATIMGKDMGTPKLRNGVVCLGKMVGYDSDDETEWQGFH